MQDEIEKIKNLFNEERLEDNIKMAAYIVLIFESFKEMVVSQVRSVYEQYDDGFENEKIKISDQYKTEVSGKKYVKKNGQKQTDVFRSSLLWLIQFNLITEEDVQRLLKIRERRNEIVHELFNTLYNGLTERDGEDAAFLLKNYLKIDNWCALNLQLVESDLNDPDVDVSGIQSMEAMAIVAIFRTLFMNEGKEFESTLSDILGEKS